jgi:hypothetical protein
MKVTVDPPKPVPAKKPRKRAPRAERLKNGVILLKTKNPTRRTGGKRRNNEGQLLLI